MSDFNKIDSALVIYRPNLQSFFYSKWIGLLLRSFFTTLLKWKHSKPILKLQTNLGASGLIVLPYSLEELKKMEQSKKEHEVYKAAMKAFSYGAKRVSLGGQLASQLNYCEDFASKDLSAHKDTITTGHSLTCLSVAATIEKVLQKTTCKTLAVIGVGSIGKSSLCLSLEKINKLQGVEVILCDIQKKSKSLELFSKSIEEKYKVKTKIVFYGTPSFQQVYQADIILGASNSPHIIKVDKLLPGTILVDDSFPPVISVKKSIQRMKEQKDVLIVGGGKLLLHPSEFKSLTWQMPQALISQFLKQLGSKGLPGCWLEAIVFAYKKEHNVTHGLITPDKVVPLWDLKSELGLEVPDLHFYKYTVPAKILENICSLRK